MGHKTEKGSREINTDRQQLGAWAKHLTDEEERLRMSSVYDELEQDAYDKGRRDGWAVGYDKGYDAAMAKILYDVLDETAEEEDETYYRGFGEGFQNALLHVMGELERIKPNNYWDAFEKCVQPLMKEGE